MKYLTVDITITFESSHDGFFTETTEKTSVDIGPEWTEDSANLIKRLMLDRFRRYNAVHRTLASVSVTLEVVTTILDTDIYSKVKCYQYRKEAKYLPVDPKERAERIYKPSKVIHLPYEVNTTGKDYGTATPSEIAEEVLHIYAVECQAPLEM